MNIDIKAIRAAAENYPSPWPMSLQPNTVLALCDEIERLRTALKLIEWSNDSKFQAQAATEALRGKQ